MFVNDQHSTVSILCTVIKLHVVKEAIQRSSIQGRNLILLLSIHSGVRLIDVSF